MMVPTGGGTMRLRFAVTIALVAFAGCGGSSGGGGGGLTLDRTSLAFSADRNGPLPPAQSIHVTVNHSEAFYIVAGYPPGTVPPSWLSLSMTGSGSSWDLQASIVSTALDAGSYPVTVRVVIARQDESVITYRDAQVTYAVANVLTAAPGTLAFVQAVGGTVPPTQSVSVAAASGTAWTASANQPWVTLSATSGTAPSTVDVGVNSTGLNAGSYNANITFSS